VLEFRDDGVGALTQVMQRAVVRNHPVRSCHLVSQGHLRPHAPQHLVASAAIPSQGAFDL
jgi:hypothetical protein